MAYLQNAGSHLLALQTGGPPQEHLRISKDRRENQSCWTGTCLQNWVRRCDLYKMMVAAISWNWCHRSWLTEEIQEGIKNDEKTRFWSLHFLAKYSSSVNFFLQIRTDGFLGFKNALTWAKMDPREWNNIRCVSFFLLLWSKIGKMYIHWKHQGTNPWHIVHVFPCMLRQHDWKPRQAILRQCLKGQLPKPRNRLQVLGRNLVQLAMKHLTHQVVRSVGIMDQCLHESIVRGHEAANGFKHIPVSPHWCIRTLKRMLYGKTQQWKGQLGPCSRIPRQKFQHVCWLADGSNLKVFVLQTDECLIHCLWLPCPPTNPCLLWRHIWDKVEVR